VINGFLRALGGEGQQWLAEPGKALWASMALSVWRYSGFTMVFYLAGLQLIAPSLYEAARVDGASGFFQLRRITLPLLKPMTALIGLLGLITALREFEIVYLLTRGGPAHSTDLLSIQAYDQAFALSRSGYAAAISVFMLGMIAVGSVFALWAMSRAHRAVAA
jgi:ABC-type sugar transport system permease subunit